MQNPVYDLKIEQFVELRPYMRYFPHILCRDISVEQWESALKLSTTVEEYATIVKSRQRIA
jgi:hypothetical protein